MRKENQYRLSIDTYQELLNIKSNLTPSIIGDALLGLGKTYEDQLLENNYQNIFKIIKNNNIHQNFIHIPTNIKLRTLNNPLHLILTTTL